MEQQTAVDWLISQIVEDQIVKAKSISEWETIYEQAKKIQKEQHSNTWDFALITMQNRGGNFLRTWEDFDEYYNENFKTK